MSRIKQPRAFADAQNHPRRRPTMISPAAARSPMFPAARLPERAFLQSSITSGAPDTDVGKRASAGRADVGEPTMHAGSDCRRARGLAA
jgi:hypothetical protein